jgi:hypothetical protein
MRTPIRTLLMGGTIALTSACVTSTVDEMVFNEPLEGIGDSSVVILGRRHGSSWAGATPATTKPNRTLSNVWATTLPPATNPSR